MLKTAKRLRRVPKGRREVQRLGRAVEAGEIVVALRPFGLSQAAIARATGTSDRSVRNWKRTSAIRESNATRLWSLREIVLVLEKTLTPRGVGQWMRAPNRLLKGRAPLEVLADGGVAAVREAADAYLYGAYV